MKNSLGVRLFFSYLLVILAAFVVLALVTQFTLPQAYGRHLGIMEESMSNNPGMGHGQGQGGEVGVGSGEGGTLFNNFRSSFNDSLIWAGLAAVAVALVLSFLISRRLAAPIHAMTIASQRISQGRYDERVSEKGRDEFGRLAESFNIMAEKLEQTEIMRRQLIGDVSHELRTPLTAIQGSMEGLIDGVLPADKDTFDQIHQETGRLARLVDDLQVLSRVESGAFTLDRKPVAIRAIVMNVTQRLERQYQAKGVQLTAAIPADLPDVLADEDRLEQILLNLINNALQYTPAGGSVIIEAEDRQSNVRVLVKDSGLGIPAEHLENIFDRFFRVDKSRSRSAGGGSGIGLTITRRLVEAQGGTIWAESPGDGLGSTFSFTLPKA